MTTPKSMSIEELMELAALDAFGLLDEYETDLYSRSFHHAPASVQDEIVRIQAELVANESLLPNETPDAGLRARVLEAVARAIEEEDTTTLAPLASIGGRLSYIPVAPRPRLALSGQFWRAAALLLASTTLVMTFFWAEARSEGSRIAMLALDQNMILQLEKEIGPTFREFLGNPSCERRVFRNKTPRTHAIGTLFVDRKTQSAFLLLLDMPIIGSDDKYTLRARLEDGTYEDVRTFSGTSRNHGLRIDRLSFALLAVVSWEITDSSGITLLHAT